MKKHGLSRATDIGCWERREHTLEVPRSGQTCLEFTC
jgi:hypothetical protein